MCISPSLFWKCLSMVQKNVFFLNRANRVLLPIPLYAQDAGYQEGGIWGKGGETVVRVGQVRIEENNTATFEPQSTSILCRNLHCLRSWSHCPQQVLLYKCMFGGRQEDMLNRRTPPYLKCVYGWVGFHLCLLQKTNNKY